jgi:hypothetical protein
MYIYIGHQNLPPRSPQMQPMSHPNGLLSPSYFSPTRGRSGSSPLTIPGTSSLASIVEGELGGQGARSHDHLQGGIGQAGAPGSPSYMSSRGASPVGSEYSYGCGTGAYVQSPSQDRHPQSQRGQQHQDSPRFTSIDQQQQQPYDGCIYQVSRVCVYIYLSIYICIDLYIDLYMCIHVYISVW